MGFSFGDPYAELNGLKFGPVSKGGLTPAFLRNARAAVARPSRRGRLAHWERRQAGVALMTQIQSG